MKKGSDLSQGITCVSCGRRAPNDLRSAGWQEHPPVCPDCLRWLPTGNVATDSRPPARFERRGRFWAVYEGDDLLCLAVYRKGAVAVVRRVNHDM